MEKCLLFWNLRNHTNVENLVGREGRRDIDVVEDEVEDELKKVSICYNTCGGG